MNPPDVSSVREATIKIIPNFEQNCEMSIRYVNIQSRENKVFSKEWTAPVLVRDRSEKHSSTDIQVDRPLNAQP